MIVAPFEIQQMHQLLSDAFGHEVNLTPTSVTFETAADLLDNTTPYIGWWYPMYGVSVVLGGVGHMQALLNPAEHDNKPVFCLAVNGQVVGGGQFGVSPIAEIPNALIFVGYKIDFVS